MYAELDKLLREEYRTLEDFRARDKAEKMAAVTTTTETKETSCSCSAAAEACSSSKNCKEPELS